MTLPFLADRRTKRIQGSPGVQLAGYLAETITVPPETLRSAESSALQAAAATGLVQVRPEQRQVGLREAVGRVLAWCQWG